MVHKQKCTKKELDAKIIRITNMTNKMSNLLTSINHNRT